VLRRKCQSRKRGPEPKIATVERREARVDRKGRRALSQAPGLPRYAGHGCPLTPGACRRSAHPSIGVACPPKPRRRRAQVKARAQCVARMRQAV